MCELPISNRIAINDFSKHIARVVETGTHALGVFITLVLHARSSFIQMLFYYSIAKYQCENLFIYVYDSQF